jgi:hypothetical protein
LFAIFPDKKTILERFSWMIEFHFDVFWTGNEISI